ncbi:unnamed protein product [Closterium sp. NIES-53]
MRLSPSLPDLTSLYSTLVPASVQSPCPTSSPSPTTGDLPPFSPPTAAPLRGSPNSSPKTNHLPGLDATSSARRAKAGGSKTSVSHGSSINRGQPRKIASLDTGPPLLRRTDRTRRYSLGGSGDYPKSFSVSAAVELSRAESFTAQNRPALPSQQSMSDTAAAPVAGEQHRGPARSRREGKGKEKEDRVRGDGTLEGYDSDEDFVKLYGLVAQHRAAERAIVSSAFAKVLSSPGQGSYSPKGGTSSGCSSVLGSGSGFRSKDGTGSGCSSVLGSGSGFRSKDGTGSGCSSIARSKSGCFSKADSGIGSIVRSGSICIPKVGTRSGCSSIIRSSSSAFPKVGSGNGCSPRFTSQSSSGSSIQWAGDIISTSSVKTSDVAADDEHVGRRSVPSCTAIFPNHGITSVEPLVPSSRAVALGPRDAIKGILSNAPCAVLRSRRMSLDSAVVNVAFTGVDERESIQSLMDLGKTQINEQRHGHQQQSQREKSFLGDQSGAEMEFPVVGTRAAISPSSKKGLAGSSRCNSLEFPHCQQQPFPSHASGSRKGFSRSASVFQTIPLSTV